MKIRITLILIFVITLVLLLFFVVPMAEGFSYLRNPCGNHTTCRSCATAAGCGWCPDFGQCQPMAQDGFPIRTEDLTTGNPVVSPYLAEGVIPVLSDCPKSCRKTGLGDCDCSVMNRGSSDSCNTGCYAVYGQGCVCPNTQDKNVAGSYIEKEDRKQFERIIQTKDRINQLLKTTRIHVCSPHTFIIDPERCM